MHVHTYIGLEALFWTQTTGAFFHAPPMVYYGSTVIGYATAFSCASAIALMFTLQAEDRIHNGTSGKWCGIFDLDNPQRSCKLTGFQPIHVAVANGLSFMYACACTHVYAHVQAHWLPAHPRRQRPQLHVRQVVN